MEKTEKRFWAKVEKTETCWNWKGGHVPDGYGSFRTPTGTTRAHRYAYEVTRGPIPKGWYVCHTCRNPNCVNPDHLCIGPYRNKSPVKQIHDPELRVPKPIDLDGINKELLMRRFLTKIEKTNDCWFWIGSHGPAGYGQFSFRGRNIKPHRLSYLLFKGPIPDGEYICHTCDVPPCVNPDHLFTGSAVINVQDKIKKGRQHIEAISAALKGKPLTPEHLANLRASPANQKGRPVRYVPPRKLTDDQLDTIAARYAKGETAEVLACEFNVSGRAILSWMRRKGVKRLSGYGTGKSSGTHGNTGRSHPGRTYTPEEIERYREMRRQWWAKRKSLLLVLLLFCWLQACEFHDETKFVPAVSEQQDRYISDGQHLVNLNQLRLVKLEKLSWARYPMIVLYYEQKEKPLAIYYETDGEAQKMFELIQAELG